MNIYSVILSEMGSVVLQSGYPTLHRLTLKGLSMVRAKVQFGILTAPDLRQYTFHQLAMYISEAITPSLVFKRKTFVIDTQ